jgi:hypothetical protein
VWCGRVAYRGVKDGENWQEGVWATGEYNGDGRRREGEGSNEFPNSFSFSPFSDLSVFRALDMPNLTVSFFLRFLPSRPSLVSRLFFTLTLSEAFYYLSHLPSFFWLFLVP